MIKINTKVRLNVFAEIYPININYLYLFYDTNYCSIETFNNVLTEAIKEAKEAGWTNISISKDMRLFGIRLETDEEYNDRKEREKSSIQKQIKIRKNDL